MAPHELLHRLNNQLGVILAHAELIEQKARTEDERARASQVVQAALQAMAVSRELSEQTSREPETLPFGTKVQN